jgi:hypothetical protein
MTLTSSVDGSLITTSALTKTYTDSAKMFIGLIAGFRAAEWELYAALSLRFLP